MAMAFKLKLDTYYLQTWVWRKLELSIKAYSVNVDNVSPVLEWQFEQCVSILLSSDSWD